MTQNTLPEEKLKVVIKAVTEEELYQSAYQQLYQRLNELPEEERLAMFTQLIPPAQLFSRIDGTLFRNRALGLSMFETKWMLENAGIQADDPRGQVFQYMRGSLIPKDILKPLRNISTKQNTVARQAGAIAIRGQDFRSKQWWVPIGATKEFTTGMVDLTAQFDAAVQSLLLDPYEDLRGSAHQMFMAAVAAAWKNTKHEGITLTQFVKMNEDFFQQQFPSRAAIEKDLKIESFPTQAALPEIVETTVMEIRTTMRAQAITLKQAAEAEAGVQNQQLKIVEIQVQSEQMKLAAARNREEEARDLRAKILRQQMGPELEQAYNLAMSISAEFMKLAQQVLNDIRAGNPISAAKRRAWNQMFSNLGQLVNGEMSVFEEALDQLKQISLSKRKITASEVKQAEASVMNGLKDMERQTAISTKADALWVLLREGRADDAMRIIINLKKKLSEDLDGLVLLEEVAIKIGGETLAIESGILPEDGEAVEAEPEQQDLGDAIDQLLSEFITD